MRISSTFTPAAISILPPDDCPVSMDREYTPEGWVLTATMADGRQATSRRVYETEAAAMRAERQPERIKWRMNDDH